ncbi:MAG TPA: acetyl-CoA decarbonylase/synthase complex subunit gamma [Candidatus Merdisoma faecalis]|uniref:acetyl-CoA decarbonylase/synthase complex subunit gamma n=1 Tax=Lachnoclostridium sp. An138 TaxID=1965560 RepID=UPI000B38D593|nr:acetyl-CoA decarbonylase/synthase complex subunit gamma [Lachnoclostridium sp. An138]OUQ18769.1 acetyl-CoA synthase subunit gamma [Lachnoclostridium sp. An138]HIR97575.1 acetyl-CoA decarbonylase/synthase complex subunit gamma [Candidatus Merdisoma faecalis]
MALKGLDIFKLTPKTNCKECGSPTCMAFAMKVAQGAVEISKCPHMSEEALATLSEATAPPMKTIKVGTGEAEYTLGGETVLYRHEKTFVSKTRYAAAISCCDENMDAKLAELKKVDYERIGERMHVEMLYLTYCGNCDAAGYAAFVKKVMEEVPDKTIVLDCTNVEAAKAALDVCKDKKPILDGADASNYEEMSKLATEAGVVLGVRGADINELYDTTAAVEKLGNKNLVLNVGAASIKDAFATTVQIRRAALKDTNRTFGYPSIVNAAALAPGDSRMQAALASLFTVKYGSIVVMEGMSYAQALPLYGLRQNVFTDPQKPMKVEPGIYPLNGGDENSVCLTTVDFALTYFVVSGELERSGVPCNLIISDAGGLSVLTAWAAGKLSSTSVSKFIQENVEDKIKCRKLIIPGKVAVLKGDIEAKLPGWEVIVAPNEAVQLVKFLKDMQANGEI